MVLPVQMPFTILEFIRFQGNRSTGLAEGQIFMQKGMFCSPSPLKLFNAPHFAFVLIFLNNGYSVVFQVDFFSFFYHLFLLLTFSFE